MRRKRDCVEGNFCIFSLGLGSVMWEGLLIIPSGMGLKSYPTGRSALRCIFQSLVIPCCDFIGWDFQFTLKRDCPILLFCCLFPNPFTRCCYLPKNRSLVPLILSFPSCNSCSTS